MSVNLITRVLRAEQSSDLSEDGGDVDFVRAAGLAGIRKRLGSMLPRFLATAGRDYRSDLIELLSTVAAFKFLLLKPVELKACAHGALYLYLNPKCPGCHGRAFEVMKDTPMLSDVQCKRCGGTGRRAIDEGERLRECLRWMEAELAQAEQGFSSAVGRKLGRN